ncbi:MAG TPA: hypothetical protein VN112_16260 [Ensifer sp.]|nr:hypothetical protein [Ensifer sp.]
MSEKGVIARFFVEAEEVKFKSEQAGRPIFEDKEKILILIPGQKSEFVGEVTEAHKGRFPEEYSRFKQGLKDREQMVGTPLKEFPELKPYQIKELEALNVFTIEHLASLSDTAKQSLGMGAHELSRKATAYLERAENASSVTKYVAENEHLKSEVESLKEQIRELASRLEGDQVKRGPGRPPKVDPSESAAA